MDVWSHTHEKFSFSDSYELVYIICVVYIWFQRYSYCLRELSTALWGTYGYDCDDSRTVWCIFMPIHYLILLAVKFYAYIDLLLRLKENSRNERKQRCWRWWECKCNTFRNPKHRCLSKIFHQSTLSYYIYRDHII